MPQILPIAAERDLIGQFLGGTTLRIPELQRPYSWGLEQAQELLNDLRKVSIESSTESAGAPDAGGDLVQQQHFFGTIVLLATGINDRRHIIDGQQRLTTTTLVLGLIEQAMVRVGERAKKAKGPAAENVAKRAAELAQTVHSLLWFPGTLNDDGITPYFPRIEVSPEIRERYLELIQGQTPRIPEGMPLGPERSLIEIAVYVQKYYVEDKKFPGLEPVEQLRHLEECFKCISQRLLVVYLVTEHANASYDLFECLNARGLDLEALDLVKVWMLSQMAGEREVGVAAAMRELSSGDRKQQSRYFADYYKLRVHKIPRQDNPKTFALASRREIFRDEEQTKVAHAVPIQDRIETELHLMQRLSPLWHQLDVGKIPKEVSGAGIKRTWGEFRLELMTKDLLHRGTLFPLLTVAAENSREDLNLFTDFIHLIERFYFRYKVICGGRVGDLDSAYFEVMKQIQVESAVNLTFAARRFQDLIDVTANDAKFSLLLQEKLSYSESSRARSRVKYFLYTLDNYSFPAPPRITIDDLSLFHIEHIGPQNPASAQNLTFAELNDLGNLTLLNPEINNKLSNLGFKKKQEKAQHLKSNNIHIDVVDAAELFYHSSFESWGSVQIQERREHLIKQALKIFKLS